MQDKRISLVAAWALADQLGEKARAAALSAEALFHEDNFVEAELAWGENRAYRVAQMAVLEMVGKELVPTVVLAA